MAKSILVADDDPDIVSIVSMSLETQGYSVFRATNGREAVDLAKTHHPDLVLMDMMMPIVSGYEAVGRSKPIPSTRDITIVGLSAKAMATDMERATTWASTATSRNRSASPRCSPSSRATFRSEPQSRRRDEARCLFRQRAGAGARTAYFFAGPSCRTASHLTCHPCCASRTLILASRAAPSAPCARTTCATAVPESAAPARDARTTVASWAASSPARHGGGPAAGAYHAPRASADIGGSRRSRTTEQSTALAPLSSGDVYERRSRRTSQPIRSEAAVSAISVE